MSRLDTYYNQLLTTKPDFYAQTSHGTILIWFRPDLNNDKKPIISAYFNGESPPIQFWSHDINTQKGNFIFRKGKDRIYKNDLIPFPHQYWPLSLANFKKPFPQFLIPHY